MFAVFAPIVSPLLLISCSDGAADKDGAQHMRIDKKSHEFQSKHSHSCHMATNWIHICSRTTYEIGSNYNTENCSSPGEKWSVCGQQLPKKKEAALDNSANLLPKI